MSGTELSTHHEFIAEPLIKSIWFKHHIISVSVYASVDVEDLVAHNIGYHCHLAVWTMGIKFNQITKHIIGIWKILFCYVLLAP